MVAWQRRLPELCSIALIFMLSALFAWLTSPKPRAILAVTTPPLLPWIAWTAHLLRGISRIFLIHGVYPQIAVALRKIRPGSTVDRLRRTINRRAY